jgi:hypothetical protein
MQNKNFKHLNIMKHFFTVIALFFTTTIYAQVGIGTSTPNASAKLEVSSTSKGLLIPQIALTGSSDVTTIASPATSLLVYNTATTSDVTPGYYYNAGTTTSPTWLRLNTGTSGVPYSGATSAVNLGAYDLTVNGITLGKGVGNIPTNTASGYRTLYSNTTGNNNTASGYRALYSNTTGNDNTASGFRALSANITGFENTASGSYALMSNTTGTFNTASGSYALEGNTEGNDNTANGIYTLYSNNTGSYNTASGSYALMSNTTGTSNTANGSYVLMSNTTGTSNTASGSYALMFNTTGNDNTANGIYTLYSNTTGSYNTASGRNAGYNLTTGSNNTLIGYDTQPSTDIISNEITLGNNSITSLRCKVTSITSLSDRRDKKDIIPIEEGLAFLKQLKPVSFTWNTRDKAKVGIKSAGFIAQELLALQKQSNIGDNLDLVSENNPEKLEARYGNLLPVIVKAIQEESAEKDKEIKALKERLDALEKQIKQILNK